MKILLNVYRRKGGKTSRLIQKAKNTAKNNKSCLYVVPPQQLIGEISEKINEDSVNIIDGEFLDIHYLDGNYDVILLDEYLLYPHKIQKFINYYINAEKVYIETTSKYLLNKGLFDLCVYLRKSKISFSEIYFPEDQINGEFKYLYNNLLTHPDTSLFVYHDYATHFGIGRFEVEYMGKLFNK